MVLWGEGGFRHCYLLLTPHGRDSNVECPNPTPFQLNQQRRGVVKVYRYTYVQSAHIPPVEPEYT